MKILFIAFILLSKELFANGSGGGMDFMQFLPFIAILVIFYFLIMRPQQKKAQTHQAMLKELRRGDRIITAGGILGTIDKVVNENEVSIEIAEGVKVRVIKATINNVIAKTQPANETSKQQKAEADPKHSDEDDTKKTHTKDANTKASSSKANPKKSPSKPKNK